MKASKPLPAAILMGGYATRLRPLTEKTPKALIDVNGRPFIAHQLDLLRSRGIERVVLCVGHLGQMIVDAVGNGAAFGLRAEYSFDGPELLGTGGALRRAVPHLGESFFVLYGDSYLECDMAKIQSSFERSGKPALMTVYRNEHRGGDSNVEYFRGRISAYDKSQGSSAMRHIDYGLGAFKSSVFRSLPEGPHDLAAIYQELLRQDQLAAYEVDTRYHEIGSPEGLEEMRRHLAAKSMRSAKQ